MNEYEQSKLDVMETLLGTKVAIIKPPMIILSINKETFGCQV